MNRSRHGWWLVALLAWTAAPLVVLVGRALAPAWPYPSLVPSSIATAGLALSLAWPRASSAVFDSVVLALATGVTGAPVAFVIARAVTTAPRRLQRAVVPVALLSVVAPPIALGSGLQVAVLSVGLQGTHLGVWLAHLVPATGYLTLFALGVMSSMDRSLELEARTLGATRWQVWARVVLPNLRRPLAEAIVLGALVSWGQLALTLLVGGGLVRTLPVELLAFVQSGNDQLGALTALALTIPPMAAVAFLRVGVQRSGATW